MSNYLKILLIIITLFVSSCSNNSDNSYNQNELNVHNKFPTDKYSHLYNSLYISIALKKSLEEEALSAFIENIQTMDDIKLFEKISRISKNSYRFDYSEIIADRWINISNESYQAYMFGLSASIDNNNLNKAKYYFNNFLRVANPINKSDYAKLIFFIMDNKNRINVVNFFEDYLEKNENHDLHLNFIELLYTFNLHEKVISHLDDIGTFNDRNLVRIFANSHSSVGNNIYASSILEKYISSKISPDRQVELELLELYLKFKDADFIEEYINSLLIKDPDNIDTLFSISRMLHEREFYNLSEKYLSFIVVENDRINILRGLNDYMLNNYEESIDHFERVNDFNYKIMAFINISLSLNKIYGFEKAFNYLENQRNKHDDKEVKLNIALNQISLLNENDRYDEVIDFCNKLLKLEPLSTNILYARAMAYESLKKIDLMEKDLRTILKIDKKNANTLNALGYSLVIHTKRYTEAYKLLLEAYEYDPGNAAILDSIAWVEYKLGNYGQALKYIESSYTRDKDPEIVEHYCEILIKNKQFDKLRKVIDHEVERNQNNIEFINKLNSYKYDAKL
tara:strand:- start:800 stop:2503 length:1704 start_codon:yes stop_codon:yes gene_type:complete